MCSQKKKEDELDGKRRKEGMNLVIPFAPSADNSNLSADGDDSFISVDSAMPSPFSEVRLLLLVMPSSQQWGLCPYWVAFAFWGICLPCKGGFTRNPSGEKQMKANCLLQSHSRGSESQE